MIRACSDSLRISARLDLPAPIGPSTAMYRGLALRTALHLYLARYGKGKLTSSSVRARVERAAGGVGSRRRVLMARSRQPDSVGAEGQAWAAGGSLTAAAETRPCPSIVSSTARRTGTRAAASSGAAPRQSSRIAA